jgi:hypothetical protein
MTMDETTQINHTQETCIDHSARAKNIQLLKAEKNKLQKEHDYYASMKHWYDDNINSKLTEIKNQIDRIDEKLYNDA